MLEHNGIDAVISNLVMAESLGILTCDFYSDHNFKLSILNAKGARVDIESIA